MHVATAGDRRRRRVGRAGRSAVLVGAALALTFVSACGSSGGAEGEPSAAAPSAGASGAPQQQGTRTLTVVASTNVWGDVVSKVAGPDVQVRSIISDPNADPHAYESTPADAQAISSADLVVYNGGGYDEFVDKALGADPASRGKAVEAFALRPDQAQENEHVWFDPATVDAVARQVSDRLGRLEPAQARGLTDRADSFSGQVDQIQQRFGAIGQARPAQKGLSSEPVPFYLERAAGIQDATPEDFSEAIEEETDPPAAAVAATDALLAGRGVNVLFFNPQTESPVTQNLRTLAQGAGIPVVEVTETLPAGKDYLTWLSDYRTSIAGAVGAPQ